MKISKFIKQLQKIEEKYGDKELLQLVTDGDISYPAKVKKIQVEFISQEDELEDWFIDKKYINSILILSFHSYGFDYDRDNVNGEY